MDLFHLIWVIYIALLSAPSTVSGIQDVLRRSFEEGDRCNSSSHKTDNGGRQTVQTYCNYEQWLVCESSICRCAPMRIWHEGRRKCLGGDGFPVGQGCQNNDHIVKETCYTGECRWNLCTGSADLNNASPVVFVAVAAISLVITVWASATFRYEV